MSIKIKRKKISIILILALIGGTMVGCGQSDTKKEESVQIKMEKYIKDAYKEDFVVEVPIMHRDEGGISNYDNAVAYPKKDKSLKFEIDYRGGKFSDNYMDVKWTKEGETVVANNLKEVYGENISYYFEVDKEINEKRKKMNYEEVIANTPNEGYMELSYYVFLDDTLDKQKEAGKIYRILKSNILDKKPHSYDLCVFFLEKKYKDYFIKNRKDDGSLDDGKLYKDKKLVNVIYIANVDNINNVSDVIKHYKY